MTVGVFVFVFSSNFILKLMDFCAAVNVFIFVTIKTLFIIVFRFVHVCVIKRSL